MKKTDNITELSRNEIAETANKSTEVEKVVEELHIALAKLGLKIIDDIVAKRVSKPEETYSVLVSLYNAVKPINK